MRSGVYSSGNNRVRLLVTIEAMVRNSHDMTRAVGCEKWGRPSVNQLLLIKGDFDLIKVADSLPRAHSM